MADIKNYLKEREKREQNQNHYKEKIRKHKLTALYRVLLVLAAFAAVVVLIMVQYKRHIYTGYDIVSSVARDTSSDATDMRLKNAILTYSKDGAHCITQDGTVVWNQTYEIQDIKVASNQDVVAIGNYNGRDIYVSNAQKQLGTITTTMPIRDITVSASGYVTAVLADTNVTWVNTYSPDGQLVYSGQTHMHNSGYPGAISLSPNGELLGVGYVYVDAGILKTNISFYNFGPVGANQSDYLVSGYTYTDLLVPEIRFMNNDTAFAVGDSRLMIYKGAQKPVLEAEYLYDQEIQSVFSNENYVGLVFLSDETENRYKMDVYNTAAEKVGTYRFNIDYSDIFFGKDNFVVYNETECVIKTFDDMEKYNGYFSKSVNIMIPTTTAYKYVLVTDNSIDVIQLK
ncbi:MAG: hypothetical protein J6C84_02540 [Lachnospiraceae bacterium]|nr:hypothetical protein [Lachnospiraceae bacterium]